MYVCVCVGDVNSLTKVLCFEMYIQSSQFAHLLVSNILVVILQLDRYSFDLNSEKYELK